MEIIADALGLIANPGFAQFTELPVNTAVRRMFLISTAMHKDAMASLAEKSHDLARTILKSDDEVERFSLYILRNLVMTTKNERMLQEIGLRGASESLSYRVAVPKYRTRG